MSDPLAVELGRRGGLKGGPARAAAMTEAERSASARHAANARWREADKQLSADDLLRCLLAIRNAVERGAQKPQDARAELAFIGRLLEAVIDPPPTPSRMGMTGEAG